MTWQTPTPVSELHWPPSALPLAARASLAECAALMIEFLPVVHAANITSSMQQDVVRMCTRLDLHSSLTGTMLQKVHQGQ